LPPTDVRIGIDLGGTKIEAVALGENGVELFRRRVDTPRGSYDGTVGAIKALVDAAERSVGARGSVGIGIPGTISPASGLVKNANSTWLNGRPFDRDLAAALSRPVRLANDANCFALSEATDGAAAGAPVVFGVIIGTGTGGGVVVQRRVAVGPNAVAGEWGHNPLPWPSADELPGEPCYCGLSGCIETFLSGSGLQRTDAKIRGIGHGHAAAEIARLSDEGDPAALAALERYCDRMARALASVINVLDPDVIVLGGGLSNIDRIYERVPSLWQKWVFSDSVATPLVKARHGDSSGVRGAAWLWNE
jgi:fructokinase